MAPATIPSNVNVFSDLLASAPTEEFLSYGGGRGRIRRLTLPLDYARASLAPLPLFQQLNADKPGVLFESVDISRVYGRYSLAVVDPPVLVEGKDNAFSVRALNERGQDILACLAPTDFPCSTDVHRTPQAFQGTVPCERRPVAEDERLQLNNVSQIIRNLLQTFRCGDRFLGLYGAFAYDFVRLFEPLPSRLPPIPTQDFRLFLPDILLFYDHLRERAFLYLYDFSGSTRSAAEVAHMRLEPLCAATPVYTARGYRSRVPHKLQSDMGREAYMAAVDEAREQMRLGEFFEVVFSHSFVGTYDRSPLELYRRFRDINPSPYQFYVSYGDEALVGASPEMFVRVENGLVQQRPISGTVPRGTDSLTDYHNMMFLLNSEKEKSELDMLIDLARNDVSRVCEPGVTVSDYRYVEKYSRVMHTVAQVEGRLSPGLTAFDAFIASLNAGTLTGAPKAAAMTYIEQKEHSRRGYYGGNVGYLTFSGQLDTGIIIRTAHLVKRPHGTEERYDVTVRVGATLLYDSEPASEYAETEAKARALLEALDSIE
jgi:anthranilate synthase